MRGGERFFPHSFTPQKTNSLQKDGAWTGPAFLSLFRDTSAFRFRHRSSGTRPGRRTWGLSMGFVSKASTAPTTSAPGDIGTGAGGGGGSTPTAWVSRPVGPWRMRMAGGVGQRGTSPCHGGWVGWSQRPGSPCHGAGCHVERVGEQQYGLVGQPVGVAMDRAGGRGAPLGGWLVRASLGRESAMCSSSI